MLVRKNFTITDDQVKKLMDAENDTPSLTIGGVKVKSVHENTQMAWQELGEELGFDYLTVRPIHNLGYKHFSAIPKPSVEQQKILIVDLRNRRLQKEIDEVMREITLLEAKLCELSVRINNHE
jgi:hypothetical protein